MGVQLVLKVYCGSNYVSMCLSLWKETTWRLLLLRDEDARLTNV